MTRDQLLEAAQRIDVRDLARDLQAVASRVAREARRHGSLDSLPEVEEIDVRLAIDDRGDLTLWDGPVDYDTHHGVACASGTVGACLSHGAAVVLATQLRADLIDEVAYLEDDLDLDPSRRSACLRGGES